MYAPTLIELIFANTPSALALILSGTAPPTSVKDLDELFPIPHTVPSNLNINVWYVDDACISAISVTPCICTGAYLVLNVPSPN